MSSIIARNSNRGLRLGADSFYIQYILVYLMGSFSRLLTRSINIVKPGIFELPVFCHV